MTSDPLPLASPPNPTPRLRDDRGAANNWPRLFWGVLLTLAVGFALPVLACYGLLLTTALAFRVMTFGTVPTALGGSSRETGPAVAVIRVEGTISSGRAQPLSAQSTAAADTLVEQIKKAAGDDQVKAILLYVNSPGGGVTASDNIYHALKNVDKPIVVMMGDLAASGGYYISMASDWIVANPNTLTGSIGVISAFPNAAGLLDKVGVSFIVITTGPRKDFGSPYRPMTSEERAYWQTVVDESYAGFVSIVAEGRGMTVDQVLPLADGRVYTGRQALELHLVDALGYEEDALAKAAELGGIQGQPRIIEYKTTPSLYDLLTQATARPSLLPSVAEILAQFGHPQLAARWVGP